MEIGMILVPMAWHLSSPVYDDHASTCDGLIGIIYVHHVNGGASEDVGGYREMFRILNLTEAA